MQKISSFLGQNGVEVDQITQEMERSARRRRERERGGEDHAPQTNRDFNQGSDRADRWSIRLPLFWICVDRFESTKEQQQTVSQQVEDQRLANQELQEAIDNSDDPETLERVARERAGLMPSRGRPCTAT